MPTSDYSRIAYEQTAEAVDGGGVSYKIAATFTPIEGDLPPGVTGIFVYRIVAEASPKSDVFARIASLADLGRAAVSRDGALLGTAPAASVYGLVDATTSTEKLYLSNQIALTFNDLQVALQARSVIEQRIDQVLLDWKTYRDRFIGTPQTAFPLFSAPVVTAATNRYVAAVAARDAANTAVTSATAALETANTNATTADTEYRRIEALRPNVCPPVNVLDTSYRGALDTFVASAQVFAPNVTAAYSPLSTHVAANGTALSAAVTAFLTEISGLSLNTAQTEKKTALNTALTAFNASASAAGTAVTNLSGAGAFQSALNQFAAVKDASFSPPVTALKTACTTLDGQLTAASQAKEVANRAANQASASLSLAQTQSAAASKEVAAALAAVLAVCPSFDPTTV